MPLVRSVILLPFYVIEVQNDLPPVEKYFTPRRLLRALHFNTPLLCKSYIFGVHNYDRHSAKFHMARRRIHSTVFSFFLEIHKE
jgi:hypothetical protein